jgi:FMN phosphatase YigB (HAD superfamily)
MNIVQVEEWEAVEKECLAFGNDGLVLWDVDGTLITYDEPLFSVHNLDHNRQAHLVDEAAQGYCSEEERRDPVFVHDQCYRAWATMLFRLVNDRVPQVIRSLQEKGLVCMALTLLKVQLYTGYDLLQWRVDHLKTLHIDFSNALPGISFLSLDSAFKKCGVEPTTVAPAYRDGILCTHHLPKGPCLEALFEMISFWPKKILFVDDQMGNLVSVGEMAKKLRIPYRGLHYTALGKVYNNALPPDWDEGKARQKWFYFFKNDRWPSH